MICKYCNANNSDKDDFCCQCGKKLHGTYCPECNTHNEDGAILCKICGARLDGVHTCIYCGAEINASANYCPHCGEMLGTPDTSEDGNSHKLIKAFRITANALAIAISVLSIVFSVFIGYAVTLRNGASVETIEKLSHNAFYFFGDALKQLSSLGSTSDISVAVEYFKVITGTLICASTIILVAVFGIIAIVRSIKGILSNEVRGGKSIAAFLAYVVGATGIVMLSTKYESYESIIYYEEVITVSTGFDSVTTAGLATIGALVGIYAIMAILSNGTKQLNKAFILNSLFAIVSLIIAVIAVGLLVNPPIKLIYTDEAYYKDIYGYNQFYFISEAAFYFNRLKAQDKPNNLMVPIILGACSFIFMYFALVMLIKTVATNAKNVTLGKASDMKGALIKAFLAAAFSTVALITAILCVNKYNDELVRISWKNSLFDYCDVSYTWLIVLTALSYATFIVEIVRKATKNAFAEKE